MSSMERWSGRVALVTGATAGIGEAVARNLAKHGMKVVGCGRRRDRLQKLTEELKGESGSFLGIPCDLESEAEILSMFARIREEYGGVDVLINNAGAAFSAPILSGQTHKWKAMLNVNVLGLSICTREAFISMQSRNVDDGHIINISSMSGHRLSPADNQGFFYASTKFAVRALTEGVRSELHELKSNIRVSSVSPGTVETEILVAYYGDEQTAKDRCSSHKILQAEDLAESVEYILAAPAHVQVHDVLMRSTNQKY